jgi:hypothetical protein
MLLFARQRVNGQENDDIKLAAIAQAFFLIDASLNHFQRICPHPH